MFPRTLPLIALVFTSGCLCSIPPAVPDGGRLAGACFDDSNCPGVPLFFCHTVTSECEAGCREKTDCTAEVRKEHALAHCVAPLGCECDIGRCVAALCGSDLDCGPTQACRNGACVVPPEASKVAGCAVFPDYVILREGVRAKFSVFAWDAQKAPVVLKAGIAWTALGPAVTGPASSTGSSAEFTAGTPNADAAQAIKATVGSASCFARVRVLSSAPPAADAISVLVTDELTGRPIPFASVLVSVPSTGAAIGSAADTSPMGLVTVPGLGGNPAVTVTVFHADYNYLTVANYDLAGARFLSLPLRRNPSDKFGGYQGTVKNIPVSSNLHLGLTGASLPGLVTDLSLTDLSFASLLGRNVPSRFKIGTAIDSIEQLPTGLFVGFAGQTIKPNVSTLGLAGVCLDATGAADETAITAGTCGLRSAWAFTGDLPLGDVPIDQFVGGFGFANVNFLKFFQRVSPSFGKFHSSIVRDVQFNLKTTPKNPDGGYRFTEANGGLAGFAPVDHGFFQSGATPGVVPLGLDLVVKLPDLPKHRNSFPDTVMLFGGAVAPGRGFIPLGMGVANNTAPLDAKTDLQSGLTSAGLVTLRAAPPHHGLEGSPFGIVALALRNPANVTPGLATSAIFSRVKDTALKFDPKGAKPIDLGTGFPAFPSAATYEYLGNRTFKFTTPPTADPLLSVTRVVFTDEADHAWVVYLDPAKAADGFRLPTPSGIFGDRTFFTGMTTGARSPFLVQQVRLNDDPASATGASISFPALVELNATNADRLADFMTGFSLVNHERPTIRWTTPSAPGTKVPKGSAVLVTVKGFAVGSTAQDDGFVRVKFSPQTDGCPDVDGTKDESNGKGEIVLTIPTTCVQTNAQMTATLMTPSGAEVLPPVSAVQTANLE